MHSFLDESEVMYASASIGQVSLQYKTSFSPFCAIVRERNSLRSGAISLRSLAQDKPGLLIAGDSPLHFRIAALSSVRLSFLVVGPQKMV
jgi:hypothetical protein